MIYIGCHLSVTDGYEAMGKTMSSFGGNTFAWFTRNPRGGKTKAVSADDITALQTHMAAGHFGPLVAHGSYTMNLCSANETTRANGLDMLSQDLARMEMLPGNLYNFHPGSHTGQGIETGIQQIVTALNQLLTPEMTSTVLLETMAGKGSEVGSTFEE
ncbi:MAG: TIM barrel protein, partial [Anaerolineaceae bacterium]|nr:TIM barrel protein [Anaerolineaceae bacterium]